MREKEYIEIYLSYLIPKERSTYAWIDEVSTCTLQAHLAMRDMPPAPNSTAT